MPRWNQPLNFTSSKKPLPELLRPETLDDFIGQSHIINPHSFLQKEIERGNLVSSLFWGPPGVGKTTLARILSRMTNYLMVELSAVKASLGEVKKILKSAEAGVARYALFLDEIHRFSKLQQDALLPAVESGEIVLLGATTENPAFSIIPALRSRMRLFEFKKLTTQELHRGFARGIAYLEKRDGVALSARGVLEKIALLSGGDLRNGLLLLEDCYTYCREVAEPPLSEARNGGGEVPKLELTLEHLSRSAHTTLSDYDSGYDAHYDHASAFQKSLRGSDLHASLYWFGKMLDGGEDPMFIARRLVITAAEDVGMADPNALLQAQAAMDAVHKIGMPEARIPLGQAVVYVASAPKSNSVVAALERVSKTLTSGHSYGVPLHLKDAHFGMAKSQGRGVGYVYPHKRGTRRISYLPQELEGVQFYTPKTPQEWSRLTALEAFLVSHHNLPVPPSPQRDQLLELLREKSGEPIRTQELAEALGVTDREVYSLLHSLEQEGVLQIEKWAQIALTEKGTP